MGNQNNEKLNEFLKPIYSLLSSCGNEMNNIIQNELSNNATEDSIIKLSSFDEEKEKAYNSLLTFKKDFEALSKYFDGTYVIEEVKKEDENEVEFFNKESDLETTSKEEIEEENTPNIEEVEKQEHNIENVDKDENEIEEPIQEIEEENNTEIKQESVENKEESENNSNDNIILDENNTLIFNKNDDVSPKVISVNETQFNKLIDVKDTNAALLNTKKVLVNIKPDDNQVNNETDDISLDENVDNNKDNLEELSDKATRLYKEGNIEEAQEIMNKISEINESLKNNEGKLIA